MNRFSSSRGVSLSRSFSLVALVGACAAACLGAACSSQDASQPTPDVTNGPRVVRLNASAQRDGDAARGRDALVNRGYVGCGIPWSAYEQILAIGGATPEEQKLPGRTGHNALLPYYVTAYEAKSGVEVVAQNCFSCHAGRINGELVLGLGSADADFTEDHSRPAAQLEPFISDPAEKAELLKWVGRMGTIAPYAKMPMIGANPADEFTGVLFAHRDPATLAWSDAPRFAIPAPEALPVDVPPWWRMRKKNAMFYIGSGQGDHARIMMTASTLCVDTVAEARDIDAYFPDVRAFITSLVPPKYPFAIDRALAEKGKDVFDATCSRCHGTYGDDASYPNYVVSIDEVKTDALLCDRAGQFQGGPFAEWFNGSFYGERSRLEPHAGYVAPPLDGIWATAPYLHNGSVPTVAALLESVTRPRHWTRSFDSKDYDGTALGWKFRALDHGQAGEPDPEARKRIYDTALPGAGNGGHLFGDVLSSADRAAVVEYLKTL